MTTRTSIRPDPSVSVTARGDDATTLATPAGPLTVVWNGEAVVAAGFTDDPAALAVGDAVTAAVPDTVLDAVIRFFAGEPTAVAAVPVAQTGSPVQEAVWAALGDIPAGAVASYGDVARAIGRPRAARAVGSACGTNRCALFVPCHRVVRSDGSLGGYGWGLQVKQALLAAESTSS